MGLIVIACARAAQSGASMSEVVEIGKSVIQRSHCIALLDTLEYLEKGGRIGKAQAILGGLLRIKPMIAVQDGEVHPYAKERTRRKAVARLESAMTDLAPLASVAVMYSTARQEADRIADSIRPLVTDDGDVMVARFGPALGNIRRPQCTGRHGHRQRTVGPGSTLLTRLTRGYPDRHSPQPLQHTAPGARPRIR